MARYATEVFTVSETPGEVSLSYSTCVLEHVINQSIIWYACHWLSNIGLTACSGRRSQNLKWLKVTWTINRSTRLPRLTINNVVLSCRNKLLIQNRDTNSSHEEKSTSETWSRFWISCQIVRHKSLLYWLIQAMENPRYNNIISKIRFIQLKKHRFSKCLW